MTLRHIFVFFSIQVLSCKCLKLAASFLVWRYFFRISRSPLRFKVMRLISRSRSENSGSAQVCAPHGYSLITFVCVSRAIKNDHFVQSISTMCVNCFVPPLHRWACSRKIMHSGSAVCRWFCRWFSVCERSSQPANGDVAIAYIQSIVRDIIWWVNFNIRDVGGKGQRKHLHDWNTFSS